MLKMFNNLPSWPLPHFRSRQTHNKNDKDEISFTYMLLLCHIHDTFTHTHFLSILVVLLLLPKYHHHHINAHRTFRNCRRSARDCENSRIREREAGFSAAWQSCDQFTCTIRLSLKSQFPYLIVISF